MQHRRSIKNVLASVELLKLLSMLLMSKGMVNP
jgi:hypothetical protein